MKLALQSAEHRNLLVISTGWATPPSVFFQLPSLHYDIAVISDYCSGYTYSEFYDLLSPYFSAYQNVDLLGWSLGAAIMQGYPLKDLPVRRITYVNATPRLYDVDDNGCGISREICDATYEGLRLQPEATLTAFYANLFVLPQQNEQHRRFLAVMSGMAPQTTSLIADLEVLRAVDSREAFAKQLEDERVNVVLSFRDRVVPYRRQIHAYEKIPNERIRVFKHAGHFPFYALPTLDALLWP